MYERRRYRSRQRGLVLGIVLLLIGGYYLLQQTFGIALPQIAWDQIWPVLLIVVGALFLWTAYPAVSGSPTERG